MIQRCDIIKTGKTFEPNLLEENTELPRAESAKGKEERMAKYKEKGKSAFLKDSGIYLIIGLVLFGIEKLVQALWVDDLFSRGIGALFMVYIVAAVMNLLLNYVGSYGEKMGFVGFCAGTGAALIFLGVSLGYGASHHTMFHVLSCLPVPLILYAAYSDHYAKTNATTTEHIGTASVLSLFLVLGLGLADAFIKKEGVSMTISLIVIGVLFLILLAVWIPRYVKQGALPFSGEITYKEEDTNYAIYHLEYPAGTSIRECRDIIASSMKKDHITRGLGEFVADYEVSAPFTDQIVINLWFKEKSGGTKSTSAYYHSRNVLFGRLRAMTEDCPYRVSWDVQGVNGSFPGSFSSLDW